MNTNIKTFGNDGKGQFSYFFVRLYADNHDEVIGLCKSLKLRHYAFILHDKDIWTVSDEKHQKGDIKDAHYHICMNLSEKMSWKQLRKRIIDIIPDCGAICQDMQDTTNCFMYLTHNTEEAQKESKHIYNSNEVISDDILLWLSDEFRLANLREKIDTLSSFIQDVLDNEFISRELYEYYRKTYGRDFIINSRFALKYLANYYRIDENELFMTPEERLEMRKELQNLNK